jgi:hypothetical protein
MPSLVLRISYAVAVLGTGLMLALGCSKTGIQSTVNSGAIEGSVHDSYTEEPLSSAMVTVGDTSVTAGKDGSFLIYNLPREVLPIKVHRDGYEDYEDSIRIRPNTEFHAFLDSIGRFAHVGGRVFLGQTEKALPGTRVSLGPRSTLTDSLGYYRIDSLRSDTYVLCGVLYGHKTCREPVRFEGEVAIDLHMVDTRLTGRVYHTFDGPVAGAQVELRDIVAVTDEEGRYEMPHVPRGRHLLLISHPDYLPAEQSVYLGDRKGIEDVRLRRLVIDTVLVVADATVMRNNFSACGSCPDWGNSNGNYGLESTLFLSHYLIPDASAPGGAWQGTARAVMRLPARPSHILAEEFQGAQLQFNLAERPRKRALVTVRQAREDRAWDETTMTWADLPATHRVPVAVYSPDDRATLGLNVTSYYAETASPPPSLVLRTDESGTSSEPRGVRIHSRQSAAEDKRPAVFFKYIR